MGIALVGTVIGSVVLPFAVVYATEEWGWRTAIASLSSGIWLITIPMLIFGLFAKSMAFGRRPKVAPAAGPGKDDTLARIMREPRFWLIGAAVFIVAMVDQAFTQHQVLIFKDVGLPKELIALGVSALGLAGIVTRALVGNMLDSTSNRGLALLWVVLSASVLMAFALVNPLLFFAFIVLRAVGHSAVLLDTTIMTKHVYGPSRLGTLIGVFTAMVSAGFAVGPWLMGKLYDLSGSYASSFILFAILPVVASALIWNIKPVYWLTLKAKKAEDVEPASAVAAKPAE
ncbi:Major Facilitator Superfamily protein [compost metagenome]